MPRSVQVARRASRRRSSPLTMPASSSAARSRGRPPLVECQDRALLHRLRQDGVNDGGQLLAAGVALRRRPVHQLGDAMQVTLDDGDEEFFLVAEVIVERGLGQPHLLSDLAHGDAAKTLLHEEALGVGQDLVAAVGVLGHQQSQNLHLCRKKQL